MKRLTTVTSSQVEKVDIMTLSMDDLKKLIALIEFGLRQARIGAFDALWEESHLIDGRSQKDWFFERGTKNLEAAKKELVRRIQN